MIKLTRYLGDRTYILGNGELGSPERMLRRYPAALTVAHVAETDPAGECLFAFDPLSRLRAVYGVDPALGADEAIAAIEALRNQPPQTPPSAEERIAAALEFQNVLSLGEVSA